MNSNTKGTITDSLPFGGQRIGRPLISKRYIGVDVPGLFPTNQSVCENTFDGVVTNSVLASLPGEEFVRLLPSLEPVKFTGSEEIYRYGEGIHYAYLPETAVISLLHILTDGSLTEAAMVGREGMSGLSALFSSPQPEYLTQVMIGGTALRIKMEVLKAEFERGGALLRSLLQYTNSRLAQISQRAVCNGRHSVEERFCTWLLMVHDRHKSNSLPLTHEQISRHLGARRAGITSIANTLRDKNMIDYSRGVIKIVDREGLKGSACECYKTLAQCFEETP